MITRKQAEQVADSLLEPSETELSLARDRRAKRVSNEQRRRESPLFPALIAAITTYVSLQYLEDPVIPVILGALVGGLFGWAARRS